MPDITSFTSSGKDILDSGTLHSFGRDDLIINLANLKYIFKFINDTGDLRYEKISISSTELELRLFNFNSNQGTTLTFPLRVGTYQNRELHLVFTVFQIGQAGLKLFHYTFFLGSTI